jgi:hypothetical protein
MSHLMVDIKDYPVDELVKADALQISRRSG